MKTSRGKTLFAKYFSIEKSAPIIIFYINELTDDLRHTKQQVNNEAFDYFTVVCNLPPKNSSARFYRSSLCT